MFDARNRALALTVARRTVSTLITLLGVAIIVFVILRLLPGNAITASLGVNAGLLSPAQHAALVHFYGLGTAAGAAVLLLARRELQRQPRRLAVGAAARLDADRPGGAGDARAFASSRSCSAC